LSVSFLACFQVLSNIGVIAGEGALKDQDCGRLGKGGIVAKDFRINHPINASTGIHNGNNPRESTIDVIVIWSI
jgi:hypothetical protein